MRKKGVLIWWSKNSSCGVILVSGQGEPERYFVHVSRIISGPLPKVNCVCEFDVSDIAPKPGKLPSALNVAVQS